jgi:hypothetical protein
MPNTPVRARARGFLALLALAAAAPPLYAAPEPFACKSGDEAAIVVELLVRSGTAALSKAGSDTLLLLPGQPENYRQTFISGTGKQTRVVALEYRFRLLRSTPQGHLIEMLPVSRQFTPPHTKEIPRDGRSRLVTAWRNESNGDEAIFFIRQAEPDEAVLARYSRPPRVRPLYRIRTVIEQAGGGYQPTLATPSFIAPLCEESSEHFENSQPRKLEKQGPGLAVNPAAPAPASPLATPGVSVHEFGEGAAPDTGNVPLPAPTPDTTPATPAPAEAKPAAVEPANADFRPASPRDEVIVEDRDNLTITVRADLSGSRLFFLVTVSGTLAAAGERLLPVSMSQTYTVYRHEAASLFITAPGAMHSYSLTFDPDWEEP